MATKNGISVDPETLRPLLESAKADLLRLREQREELDGRIRRMEEEIPKLESKLNSAERDSRPGDKKARRRKGENARLIFDLFSSQPEGKGLSIQEVAEKVGIGHSSARAVLDGAKDMYEKGSDGLYRRTKLVTAASLSKNTNG